VLTMPAAGSGTSDTTGQRRHSGCRYRVFSQFHSFRSMGSSQRQQRRLALCRWDHTVRTGHGAARRDHAARRRLEPHVERGMDRATGGTAWFFCYRSRKTAMSSLFATAFSGTRGRRALRSRRGFSGNPRCR
jgi:hypothetical protein